MRRRTPQLYVGIAAFDVANRRTRSAGCKCCNALVKVDRVVYGCADLNDQDRIRSSRRFDSNPIYQDRIRSEFSTRIGSNLKHKYVRRMTNNRITEQFSSLLPELRNAGNCRIPYHTSGVVTLPCGRAVVITVGMVAIFPDCGSNVIE